VRVEGLRRQRDGVGWRGWAGEEGYTLALNAPAPGVSSSLLGPEDSSFRALSGRHKFTARHQKLNKDSSSSFLVRDSVWFTEAAGRCRLARLGWRGGVYTRAECRRACCGTEAGSYLRLIDSFLSLSLRLKDLLVPVTRVKKKKKKDCGRI